jgi:uncharacterized membrane protein
MSQKQWILGFDESHKERGKIGTNYTILKKTLENQGLKCFSFTEFPITRQILLSYDIIVFACPDFSKFSPQEIESIKQWVIEDGGGLLMLSHAGGDKGRRSNLTELGEQFGMLFENDQVLDKKNNLGVENLPLFNQFAIQHPIVEGVASICYRAGCSMMSSGAGNSPVVSSGEDAEPFNTPLILAGECGEGRVIGIGSYEMFRDKITGGIGYEHHSKILCNIFQWLQTSKREKIQSKIPVPAEGRSFPIQGSSSNVMAPEISNNPLDFQGEILPSLNQIPIGAIPRTFSSQVKIISKDSMYKAFEDVLTSFYSFKERMNAEFDVIKTNLENLMKAIIASEEDIIQAQTQSLKSSVNQETTINSLHKSENVRASSPTISHPTDNKENESGISVKDIAARIAAQESEIRSSPFEQDSPDIPSHSTLKASVHLENIPGAVPKEPGESTEQSPIESPSTRARISHTKEEMESELQSLEKKIISINELRGFVLKKLETGGPDQSKYEKQLKKMEQDLAKTKFQIDEIKGHLKK